MTNSNLEKGIPWRFGPDWPGQRCGAKTRKGTPCQRPAYKRNGRCSLHGGRSTGPKTEDGLARLTAARTTHGKYTKEKRAAAKRYAEQGRQMCQSQSKKGLLKELNDAQSVGALAAILQAHNREINQLRSIDPVRIIHINNLIKYRKQIEGLQ